MLPIYLLGKNKEFRNVIFHKTPHLLGLFNDMTSQASKVASKFNWKIKKAPKRGLCRMEL
jgi:hypothetical protein